MTGNRMTFFTFVAAALCASVFAERDASVEVKRVFREERPALGDTGIMSQQPIDEASWVWPEGVEDMDVFVRFACDFKGQGEDLVLDVSADNRFALFLDGRLIARGPHRGEVFRWRYQTYAVTGLGDSTHRLEAVVHRTRRMPSGQLSHRGGFIVKASGSYDSQLTTGKACWRAARIRGMKAAAPASCYGGAYAVLGTCYLDEIPPEPEWRSVAVVAGAVGKSNFGYRRCGWALFPSERPDMLMQTVRPGEFVNSPVGAARRPGAAFEIAPRSRVELLWDLGDYYCAYPRMSVAGGKGAKIRWGWTESLMHDDGKKRDRSQWRGKTFPEKRRWAVWDEFQPDGRDDGRFCTPWWRAGRWCKIVIETAGEKLKINDIALEETHYPYDADASEFSSDDEQLDAVWKICRRGLEMCSHETYMDCPFHEQFMYPGDTRIEALVAAVASGDDRLTRYAITQFDEARRPDGIGPLRSPDAHSYSSSTYTMCWIMMLRDYAMWHADKDTLKWRLPGMRHALSGMAAYSDDEGLLEDLPGWSFTDWVMKGKNRFFCGIAPDGRTLSCINNLFYLNALRSAEYVERACGQNDFAELWHRRADRLAEALQRKFWCGEKSLFADNVRRDLFSEHAQCLALLGGAVPEGRERKCFEALVAGRDGMARASTYFSFYLFETFARFGREDLIRARLDDWKNFLAVGAKTPFENQDVEFRSDCHAWSAAPLYFAGTVFAGVAPSSPFFSSVRIAPRPAGLERVRCKVPTPKGSVTVDLRFSGGEAKGFLDIPSGLPGEFVWRGKVHRLQPGRNTVK